MIELIRGDCLEEMKKIPENSVDSIVTDPPYELGFMGKSWDNTGIANSKEMWREAMRVLKPGGHLLAFSGTRTYHRMACAIEDAGFEVRDMIEWVYGSGFPKSLNIGKAVDKLQGNEREVLPNPKAKQQTAAKDGIYGDYEATTHISKGTSEWEGWGTALKPSHEPICMARKPLAEKTVAENVLKYGTGGINIDESRVETDELKNKKWNNGTQRVGEGGAETGGQDFHYSNGEVNGNSIGRFPANLLHDNSEEVRGCFPEQKSGKKTGKHDGFGRNGIYSKAGAVETYTWGDSGNASRFFKSIIYQAKSSKSERTSGGTITNGHPTIKPIALMSYLIKMVTPEGGTVLDPFMGSGSTGVAAKENGYSFIGIDMTPEYVEIAKKRINL